MSEVGKNAASAVEVAFPEVLERSEAQGAKKTLALALRSLRKKAGLTQSQVAERIGCAQPMVSRLESPTGPLPSTNTIIAYARVCQATTSVVFHLDGDDDVEAALTDSLRQNEGSGADA